MRNGRCLGELGADVKSSASSIISPRRLSLEFRGDPPSKLFGVGLLAWINVVVSLTLSLNFVDSPDTLRCLSAIDWEDFALLRQV